MMELLLVLTLLLVLGGLAVSRLQGVSERHHLREIAENVRQHMNQGRLRAAETGLIYQFTAENGGGNYLLAPLDSIDPTAAPVGQVAGQLPSTARFELVESAGLIDPGAAAGADGSAVAWCTPILFFPDGTSSGGALDLADDDQRYIRMVVRGLTAACAVSEPQRRETP